MTFLFGKLLIFPSKGSGLHNFSTAIRRFKMSNPSTVVVIPKLMCRRFSTGSLQYIKQTEEINASKTIWDKWAKGFLVCVSVGGLSFSAVSTRNLYDSKQQKCKAYWNRR